MASHASRWGALHTNLGEVLALAHRSLWSRWTSAACAGTRVAAKGGAGSPDPLLLPHTIHLPGDVAASGQPRTVRSRFTGRLTATRTLRRSWNARSVPRTPL